MISISIILPILVAAQWGPLPKSPWVATPAAKTEAVSPPVVSELESDDGPPIEYPNGPYDYQVKADALTVTVNGVVYDVVKLGCDCQCLAVRAWEHCYEKYPQLTAMWRTERAVTLDPEVGVTETSIASKRKPQVKTKSEPPSQTAILNTTGPVPFAGIDPFTDNITSIPPAASKCKPGSACCPAQKPK